ncbi:MAG: hypothetical protein ABIE07_05955 [Candidatus Zixiibacteriota bacterium]
MRLSKLYGARVIALTGILFVCCLCISCREGEQMPEQLTYKFSYGPRLEKLGDEISLTYIPHSSDAQRPQLDSLFGKQGTVKLKVDDFKAVWKKIKRIDVSRYANLSKDDFNPTPPDVNYTESLSLVINGETIIDWSREFGKLNDKLAKPLNNINDVLMKLFNKRLEVD